MNYMIIQVIYETINTKINQIKYQTCTSEKVERIRILQ